MQNVLIYNQKTYSVTFSCYRVMQMKFILISRKKYMSVEPGKGIVCVCF